MMKIFTECRFLEEIITVILVFYEDYSYFDGKSTEKGKLTKSSTKKKMFLKDKPRFNY